MGMFKRQDRGHARYQVRSGTDKHRGAVDARTPSRPAAVDLTAAPRPEPAYQPSPGAWTAPAGARPGWDWTPPAGAVPRPERMNPVVRLWARTPVLDRFALGWMWRHGGFDIPSDR
jgi:hypothetical protein